MSTRLSAVVFAIVAFASVDSSADVATEGRFFDAIGRRAYDAGQYEAALEAFLLVQEIAPSNRVLYNIAVCADLAGSSDVAFVQYREYLASDDSDADRRRDAERRAKRLEGKLALVEVTSDPPGAEIYVDRDELGEHGVTPRIIAVAGGERKVILELSGCGAASTRVFARTGSLAHVNVSLERHFGQVAVDVIPQSATLEFLRDKESVPFTVVGGRYRLPVGQYTVRVSAPGYVAATERLLVGERDPGRLAVGLEPLPRPTGRLLVASGTVSADVLVDGVRVAVTPATLPDVPAGEHDVEVRSGPRTSRRHVTIDPGRATYLEVNLGRGTR